jgi:hypothetical protein
LDSWLIPCDGESGVEPTIKALLKSDRQRERENNFCFCMHAWPHSWGGPGLPRLDENMKRWKGREPWWYANQNELSAYRYQNLYSKPELSQDPKGTHVSVQRFEGWALGDNVPLTLKVWGYGSETPTATYLGETLKVQRSREKSAWLVELPQAPGHGVPEAFEWHRNTSNRSDRNAGLEDKGRGGLEGLASRVHVDGPDLYLHFKAKDKLEDLRVTWRIPLGWDAPPTIVLGSWPAGKDLTMTAHLGPNQQPLASQGRPYFAAQLDFLRDGKRIRLYSDCRGPAGARDPQFPKGGFLVMGPLPGDRKDFDVDLFASKVLKHKRPVRCQNIFENVQACWEVLPADRLDPLHPELIPAGAVMAPHPFYTWDPTLYYTLGHKLQYLMAGVVESPVEREAMAVFPHGVRRIYINGKRLRVRKFLLKAGPNLITMQYRAGVPDGDAQGTFSEKNYGPFFRLNGLDGKRLTDIQYHMPDWLDDSSAKAATPAANTEPPQ